MRRFLRAERLLDVVVLALAIPTITIAASMAITDTQSPAAASVDRACTRAAPSGCFANPERRERSLAKGREADVERAWRAADMQLTTLGAPVQHRERRFRLALERCDATAGGGCTTALRTE